MTAAVPHPYEDGMAEAWIADAERAIANRAALRLAIELRAEANLIGSVGLELRDRKGAELGYWLGRHYWGRGYAREAAAALISFAFAELDLDWIEATALPENAASIGVLRKLGFASRGRCVRDLPARGTSRTVECFCLARLDDEGNPRERS